MSINSEKPKNERSLHGIAVPLDRAGQAGKENPNLSDNDFLRAENKTQAEEITRLRARIVELEASIGGTSGYLVSCPNGDFSGKTAGVQFRGGRAFIPDGPEATRLTGMLAVDFGYQVEHVENWQDLPQAEALKRSFIDMLSLPQSV